LHIGHRHGLSAWSWQLDQTVRRNNALVIGAKQISSFDTGSRQLAMPQFRVFIWSSDSRCAASIIKEAQ
jgi:hypothetical protein